jgi:hypothetical protein
MNKPWLNKSLTVIALILLGAILCYNLYEIGWTIFYLRPAKEADAALSSLMNANYIGTIFMAIMIMAKRQFKMWYFPLIWIAGFLCDKYGVFDVIIHNFLINHHLHPFLLIHSNPKAISMQSDKTFFSSLLYVVCLIFMCFKRNRTFDRIIFFTVFSSIVATTFFFHRLVAHELSVKDSNIMTNMVGTIILNDKDPDHTILKKLNIATFVKDNNTPWNKTYFITQVPSNFYDFPENAVGIAQEMDKKLKTTHEPASAQMFFNNSFNQGNFILFAVPQKNNTTLYYILGEQINSMITRDEIWFFTLCLMAHNTWFFGAIFIWWYHKNRLFKRRAVAQKE